MGIISQGKKVLFQWFCQGIIERIQWKSGNFIFKKLSEPWAYIYSSQEMLWHETRGPTKTKWPTLLISGYVVYFFSNTDIYYYSLSGVFGNLTFQQDSPYHGTHLKVNLEGLDNRAKGYHVHQFPITDPVNRCSARSVGGHVNPWGINVTLSPPPNSGESLVSKIF